MSGMNGTSDTGPDDMGLGDTGGMNGMADPSAKRPQNPQGNPADSPSASDDVPRDEPRRAPRHVRVAVVDDHEMFRRGVIDTITPDCDVVGQAATVEEAIQMIGDTQPDVVLLDVHVPGGEGGGGAEIILKSLKAAPRTLYLALSVSDSPIDVGSVIRAGARGYVTKTITASDLLASIHQVAEGYAVFSPRLAGFVLSALRPEPGSLASAATAAHTSDAVRNAVSKKSGMVVATGPDSVANGAFIQANDPFASVASGRGSAADPASTDAALAAAEAAAVKAEDDASLDTLTPREQQVMRLIARGYSYKEVAAELFISVKTVETHVSAVLRKLQLSNRGELARWAAYRRIV